MIHLCNNQDVRIQGVIYQTIRYMNDTFEFVVKDARGQTGKPLDLRLRIFTLYEIEDKLEKKKIIKIQ